MVNTDVVRISVELVDNFSPEFKKIRAQLRAIDERHVKPEFEIPERGEFAEIYSGMEGIDNSKIKPNLEVDVDEGSIAKAEGVRQMLARDINVGYDTKGSTFRSLISQAKSIPTLPIFPDIPGPVSGGGGGRYRAQRGIRGIVDSVERLGKSMTNYIPSIMDYWQLLAILIPVIVALAGAALGAAAAIAGLGVAAAGLVGIGLLGWGTDAQETMRGLKQEVKELGSELFTAIQPTAQEFQPISERFINAIPSAVEDLNDELSGLTAFEEGVGAAGAGLIDWIEEAIAGLVNMQEKVVQVALRIGDALGSFLIEILQFGVNEIYRNQEAYIKLADTLVDIIAIIFSVARVITFVIAQFGFLFDWVAKLTGFLSNRWVSAILTAATAIGILTVALGEAVLGFAALNANMILGKIIGFFQWIIKATYAAYSYAAALWSASAAMATLVGLSTLGIGLGAAYLGMEAFKSTSGPKPGSTGMEPAAAGGTTINIQGDVGEREMDRIMDHLNTQ